MICEARRGWRNGGGTETGERFPKARRRVYKSAGDGCWRWPYVAISRMVPLCMWHPKFVQQRVRESADEQVNASPRAHLWHAHIEPLIE